MVARTIEVGKLEAERSPRACEESRRQEQDEQDQVGSMGVSGEFCAGLWTDGPGSHREEE